ncbi:MAG: quinone oxidoreductase [Alphaproteobacteria bacterium]|nr:MAG: quinone oxidoreductase [Alphaproteobacteria bacterium]
MVARIEFARTGGPEVLALVETPLADPGPCEVRVRHRAIGVNFIDCYHRSGLYPMPLPSGIGLEAAGVVEAVGEGVTTCRAGDRVGYFLGPPGAYAEARNIAADRLVKLPDAVDDRTAAAVMLKGATVEYLVRRVFPVKAGDVVLFHAAAGGVGLLACQWLKALGARTIATAGSPEKAALARDHGADAVILYREEDVVTRVRALTEGRGVDVVYDGVGRATFAASLDCLRPRGYMVSYGNASGAVGEIDVNLLQTKGSLFLTRPSLMHYYANAEEIAAGVDQLFEMVTRGALRPLIGQEFPLARAADAHRALESRATRGATILLP